MNVSEYIKVYEATVADINFVYYDAVLEADNNDNIDDEQTKRDRSKQISDRIGDIFQHILTLLEKLILTVMNAFKKVNLTDKGFRKELRDAEINVKPLNGIKLTMFQYVNEVLETESSKFKNTVIEAISLVDTTDINKLKDESNPMNMTSTDLEQYMLKKMGCPSEIKDMTLYFQYIKKLFRGKKQEKVIMQDTIRYHMSVLDSYKPLTNRLNIDKASMFSQIHTLRSKLKISTSKPDTPDETKRVVARQMKNVAMIYNMYGTFIGIFYQLKVEQMLNSRIVLKRFYQF